MQANSELQIEMVAVEDLRPNPANPRRHNQAVDKVAESIQQFGFRVPIVVSKRDNQIEAGHARWLAAKKLGLQQVPVLFFDDDPVVAAAFNIADNRARDFSEWDDDSLASLLVSLQAEDALLGTGFTDGDLRELLDLVTEPAEETFDVAGALESQVEPRIKRGEVWQLGRHRLMCGDSAKPKEVNALLNGARFYAVLTDPPYGIEHEGIAQDDPKELASLYAQMLTLWPVEDAVFAVFQSPRQMPIWLDAIRAQGHKFERLLWLYRRQAKTYPWRGWALASDAIVLSSLGTPRWPEPLSYCHDTYIKTELEDDWLTGKHTAIKPLWVCEDILAKLPDGMVAEPFLGSGTTLIAAEKLGRICYGMEIEPRYCEIAIQRWEDYTGEKAVRVG